MRKATFTETQKFNKWWHFVLAGFPAIIMIISFLLVQNDLVKTKNNQKEPLLFLILIFVTACIFIWFKFLQLKTHIDEKSITANYSGIPFCKRIIEWKDIRSVSIITYSPLNDYGGWLARYSLSGNGWCYNVSGDDGIKIIYKNGKSFLIGTQQPNEAAAIINFYFKNT